MYEIWVVHMDDKIYDADDDNDDDDDDDKGFTLMNFSMSALLVTFELSWCDEIFL